MLGRVAEGEELRSNLLRVAKCSLWGSEGKLPYCPTNPGRAMAETIPQPAVPSVFGPSVTAVTLGVPRRLQQPLCAKSDRSVYRAAKIIRQPREHRALTTRTAALRP
jgi:hypothetical protein